MSIHFSINLIKIREVLFLKCVDLRIISLREEKGQNMTEHDHDFHDQDH